VVGDADASGQVFVEVCRGSTERKLNRQLNRLHEEQHYTELVPKCMLSCVSSCLVKKSRVFHMSNETESLNAAIREGGSGSHPLSPEQLSEFQFHIFCTAIPKPIFHAEFSKLETEFGRSKKGSPKNMSFAS